MSTDDVNDDSADADGEEDVVIKSEVKEEAEDDEEEVGSDFGWNDGVGGSSVVALGWEGPTGVCEEVGVTVKEEEEVTEEEDDDGRKVTGKRQKVAVNYQEDELFKEVFPFPSEEEGEVKRKRGRPRIKTKEGEEDQKKEDGDEEEDKPRRKLKKKDEEWNESIDYFQERANPSKYKEGVSRKNRNPVPPMPAVFSCLEDFKEYLEKRVNHSINTAMLDDEDPRCYQHFYLGLHECTEAGLSQGLITPEEVDDIWTKWDELAVQTYEDRERNSKELKKKKRMVGRHYIKVNKVYLKGEAYQDMLRKTRRLKSLVVRDLVLKNIENNGENKIKEDLNIRRGFFKMLLDVPGATDKVATLSTVKNLWRSLVYGKKDDWVKYLTNKERILEKRKELHDPENLKMRRYLYRQAYLASLTKEEKEKRNREKQEYLKRFRSTLSEEKRQKMRERNKKWRESLTGEKRDRYIEKVYSAIRKRNERLKYEKAGLKPPEELMPVRKGRRSSGAVDKGESSKTVKVNGQSCWDDRGARKGRGCPREDRLPFSNAPPPPATRVSSDLILGRTLENVSSQSQVQVHPQPALSSTCPNFGMTSTALEYISQGGFSHQSYQNLQLFPPIPPPISKESSQPNAPSPAATPPYNYSMPNHSQDSSSILQQESYHENNHGFDEDGPPSPSPEYFQDDSISNPEAFLPPSTSKSPSSNLSALGNSVISGMTCEKVKREKLKEIPRETSTSALSSSSLGTPEICEECGMQFARSYDLRKHISFAHNEDEANRLCPVCNKEFNLPRSLWRHIVRHHGGVTDGSKDSKRKRETRVNHGPCKCEICGKDFAGPGDIRKAYRDHMRRVHNKKDKAAPKEPPKAPRPKMVRCEFCDKEMLYISLQRHIRNAHQVGEVQSFACNECGKSFKEKRYLTDHVRLTHSFNFQKMIESRQLLAKSYSKEDPGKEMYTCTVCSENIPERLEFRTHLLKKHPVIFQEISSSGSAFSKRECEICNASFPKEIQLREHLTSKHPDISWSCPHCAKFYCVQSSLQKHIKNIHTPRKSKEGGNGGEEENGKKCPKCDDLIEGSEQDMWAHIKTMHSEIILYCKYCSKPKWSKKLLSDHQRICKLRPREAGKEVESAKLLCPMCGKKLKNQLSLDRHIREIHKVHKLEYKCEESDCEEVFAQKKKLNDHLEQVHKVSVQRKRRWKKDSLSKSTSKKPSVKKPVKEKRRQLERNKKEDTKNLEVKVERLSDDELNFYLKSEPE